jgi:hypothetical protein
MFYVSRQHQYTSGRSTVEVESGGMDCAGPDMLVPLYSSLGEGQEYSDPREAVEAAIAVCRAWRADGEKRASVAFGSTGGMGVEIEPATFETARKWAERVWEGLPKCMGCVDPLPSKHKRWRANDYDGFEYCSESCAETAREYEERETARLNGEDGA